MAKTDLFEPNTTAAMVPESPGGDKPLKPVKTAKSAPVAKVPVPVIEPPKGFPKPGDPYWQQHPLLTEHKDGTVRAWGEDSTTMKNPNTLPKQMMPPPAISDKAKRQSNSYYPVNH